MLDRRAAGPEFPIRWNLVNANLVIAPHPDGSIVDVWVVPRARRTEVAGIHDGALRVRVATAPERGRANRAVVRLLKRTTGAREVYLDAGAQARRKRFVVVGLDSVELASLLG